MGSLGNGGRVLGCLSRQPGLVGRGGLGAISPHAPDCCAEPCVAGPCVLVTLRWRWEPVVGGPCISGLGCRRALGFCSGQRSEHCLPAAGEDVVLPLWWGDGAGTRFGAWRGAGTGPLSPSPSLGGHSVKPQPVSPARVACRRPGAGVLSPPWTSPFWDIQGVT